MTQSGQTAFIFSAALLRKNTANDPITIQYILPQRPVDVNSWAQLLQNEIIFRPFGAYVQYKSGIYTSFESFLVKISGQIQVRGFILTLV